MRIVSLLPSATEILFALGLDREIAGVSHECDFPTQARTKPVVIHSRLPQEASPSEIDRLVREYVSRGESLYSVDVGKLEQLHPDLIITQDLCHVCAASPDDLATALMRMDCRPEVLCLADQEDVAPHVAQILRVEAQHLRTAVRRCCASTRRIWATCGATCSWSARHSTSGRQSMRIRAVARSSGDAAQTWHRSCVMIRSG